MCVISFQGLVYISCIIDMLSIVIVVMVGFNLRNEVRDKWRPGLF